jgi:2-keto-4-pentenoate hydratase/2-oxohepta-3-ene-1,7-dioic acid hydratase in catechol pathway
VSKEAFDDMTVQTKVNGESRQNASVKDLIFDIPTLIETCSMGITLQEGDVIATGTPAGVALSSGKFLQPGDVVEVSITGLGTLSNTIDREDAPYPKLDLANTTESSER